MLMKNMRIGQRGRCVTLKLTFTEGEKSEIKYLGPEKQGILNSTIRDREPPSGFEVFERLKNGQLWR